MHPMEPVELRGGLVAIEPLRAEHAAALLAAADSEEVFAWLPYPRPADLGQARAWIDGALADRRAKRRFPFAVLLGLRRPQRPRRDRLDLAQPSFMGNRAQCGGKAAVDDTRFEALELERVAFRTDILNERSQQAIERLGATKEGVHRHEMRRRDGSWRDSVHYSILRAEWPDAKESLRRRIAAVEAG